jgi:A/G-specific adenine glycosylase
MKPEIYISRLGALTVDKTVLAEQIAAFRRLVRSYYRQHGRRFAWRNTYNPYRIMVSEIMLQQTQTSRVSERYPKFLEKFPTVKALAAAPLYEVLKIWEGMGYYRRAKNLHACAQYVCDSLHGRIPEEYDALLSLPGIGSYTAAAISVFAYNSAIPMIETNIRCVYTHTFFPEREQVTDKEIMVFIDKTMDRNHPREWFYSLMDIGVVLKKYDSSLNQRSAQYVRQSKFHGSNRELAAKILKLVLHPPYSVSIRKLATLLDADQNRVQEQVSRLETDKLIRVSSKGIIERI